MDLDARTAELFEHFSTQEFAGLADLFAPDAQVKQNGNPEHGIAGLFTMIEGLKRDGVTVQYSDVRRSVGDRFVVEQHAVRLARPDGVSASTEVCVGGGLRRCRSDQWPARILRHRCLGVVVGLTGVWQRHSGPMQQEPARRGSVRHSGTIII